MSEHLKGAWAALMRGDTDERDRLCAAERSEVQFVQPPKSFPDEFDF